MYICSKCQKKLSYGIYEKQLLSKDDSVGVRKI